MNTTKVAIVPTESDVINTNITEETVIKNDKLDDFLTSPVNPLHDVSPPKQIRQVQSDVLLQADDIRKTLNWVSETNPSARSHVFPYVIFKPNADLLIENGFKVQCFPSEIGSLQLHTEVSWDSEDIINLIIPAPTV